MARDLWDTMRALYASEINCGMASFWDAGFVVWLGDDMNGREAEEQFFSEDFDQIADWLHQEALHHYPASDYARKYQNERALAGPAGGGE